ncbi:MAG: BlaI/MecI/CopY family transcriptional regulator [Peptococcaceae bacterium]|nr:BlaI/MecI/CopY family transcriptional regulator [Peptococcaceae bacterium]
MEKLPQISESELEVMKILWDLGQATSSQIIDRLTKTSEWKPKTIQTLISRLVAKQAIQPENTGGKAFLYIPLVDEDTYKAYASKSFLQKVFDGSLNLMVASFIREQKMTQEEIKSLKKLLDEEV